MKKAPSKAVARKAAPSKAVVVRPPGAAEHELRLRGYNWEEVAEQVGHPDGVTAFHVHQRFIQTSLLAMEAEDRRRALSLEVERLDRLQTRFWPAVERGDLDAARFVLSVIQARIKAQRLDEDGDTGGAVRTVVIAGNTAQYVATLKQLLNEQGAIDVETVDEGD